MSALRDVSAAERQAERHAAYVAWIASGAVGDPPTPCPRCDRRECFAARRIPPVILPETHGREFWRDGAGAICLCCHPPAETAIEDAPAYPPLQRTPPKLVVTPPCGEWFPEGTPEDERIAWRAVLKKLQAERLTFALVGLADEDAAVELYL